MHSEQHTWRDPVLAGFVLATAVGALVLHTRPPFTVVVNYVVLLPLYIGVITFWTRRDPPLSATDIGRTSRWREIVALAAPWMILVAVAVWAWYVRSPPRDPGPPATSVPSQPSIDLARLLRGRANNALASTLKITLPTVLLCAIAGMSWRRLGLAPRHLGLGVLLAALGVVNAVVLAMTTDFELAMLPLFSVPAVIVPYFLLQLLINAVPEELLARGLTMQRWLALTRAPGVAIAISTVFFALIHVPFRLMTDPAASPASLSLEVIFSPQPTGVVWAYLFYRTRSLWPGIVWHGSFVVLGVVFL